jgi:hypothetical protein
MLIPVEKFLLGYINIKLLNFPNIKALVALLFSSVIPPLITFKKQIPLMATLQVIMVLMIPVSFLYDLQGPSL